MMKKRLRGEVSNENVRKFSAPPGFVSLTSFKLKRVGGSEQTSNFVGGFNSSNRVRHEMDLISKMLDVENLEEPCQRQPWILEDQINHEHEESHPDQVDMVTEQWLPGEKVQDSFEEAPTFYPTEEEFRDTIKYIASLRQIAGSHGICRVVPPPSWNPPCIEKENNMWQTSPLVAQVQWIGGIQNQYKQSETIMIHENGCIERHNDEVDLEQRFDTLESFKNYADEFKSKYFRTRCKVVTPDLDPNICQEQQEISVEDIEDQHMRLLQNCTEKIKVIYCDNLKSGIDSGASSVSKSQTQNKSNCHEYLNSGWNLSNTPRLPMSLLSFENSRTCDLLVPRLKIGMCFSSSFWKVEEHHLYSLCYMHMGAPKIWYGIPGTQRVKFEAFMKKHIPNLSMLQPKLCDRKIATLTHAMVISGGFPVYRCVQHPGEFIVVFPEAYYSEVDTGFNCVEAVNVAPIDWLPYGQNVVELYCGMPKKTAISHDKLLLGAMKEAVRAQWEISMMRKNSENNLSWKYACGKDGILAKAFKSRVKLEDIRREFLCTSSQSQKMDVNFDATRKRECSICFYDLHLSAACCPCSVDRYTCLNHAKQLCSCAWSERKFLFRYTMNELSSMADALEGKLSAVYLCARDVLKLSLCAILEDKLGDRVSRRKESKELEHNVEKSHTNGSTAKRTREKMKLRLQEKSLANKNQKPIKVSAKPGKETVQSIKMKQGTKNLTSPKNGSNEPGKQKQATNASLSFLAAASLLAFSADSSSESSSSSSS